MTTELLSRWQSGVTTFYLVFVIPLTLRLVLLIAVMETFYVRTAGRGCILIHARRIQRLWGSDGGVRRRGG